MAAALERLAQTLLTQVERRLELLGTEVVEEEIRFARLLLWQAAALFLGCVTVLLVALAVVAAYWDTPTRLYAIAWTAGLTASAAVLSWRMVAAQRRRRRPPFAESLAELRKDGERLGIPAEPQS